MDITPLKHVDARDWIRPYLTEEKAKEVFNYIVPFSAAMGSGLEEVLLSIRTDDKIKTIDGRELYFTWYSRTYEKEMFESKSLNEADYKDFAGHINNMAKLGWIEYGILGCIALELAQVTQKQRTLLSLFTFSKYPLAKLQELTGQ